MNGKDCHIWNGNFSSHVPNHQSFTLPWCQTLDISAAFPRQVGPAGTMSRLSTCSNYQKQYQLLCIIGLSSFINIPNKTQQEVYHYCYISYIHIYIYIIIYICIYKYICMYVCMYVSCLGWCKMTPTWLVTGKVHWVYHIVPNLISKSMSNSFCKISTIISAQVA